MSPVVLASTVLLVGCGGTGGDSGHPAAPGATRNIPKVIRVGSEVPYPPFEFGRPPYRGFEVDIVKEIARRLRVRTRFVNTPFNTIFRELGKRKFDMVAAGVVITPAAQQKAGFSHPYLPANLAITVKRGRSIRSTGDLAGKTLGAQSGSPGADYARTRAKARSVRTYVLIDDALNALAAGQLDAVIHDYPVSKFAERSRPNLVVAGTIATGKSYGFAFPKGSSLESGVNEALDALERDGADARIYRKWFNAAPRG
jgi:ABC-type amino acid transport substrate-binding protein